MTDNSTGWCFLNVRDEMVAWNTYRGVLLPAPQQDGFVTVRAAAVYRSLATDRKQVFALETALEHVRAARHAHRRSRLKSIYCFEDLVSAERAVGWGGRGSYFQPEFLAELDLAGATGRRDKLDANWITFAAPLTSRDFESIPWMDMYWEGRPMPDREPIWETLLEGPVRIVSEELRERAYGRVVEKFPESLAVLETGRLAAKIDVERGNMCAWIFSPAGQFGPLRLDYLIADSEDPRLMLRLREEVVREAHRPRIQAVAQSINRGEVIRMPDMRPHGFDIPRTFNPFSATGPAA